MTREQEGAFYTPPQAAAIMWRQIAESRLSTSWVYDPACGQGGLLNTAPQGLDLIGSTLNEADLAHLRWDVYSFQRDWLADLRIERNVRRRRANSRGLIVCNPPYMNPTASNDGAGLTSTLLVEMAKHLDMPPGVSRGLATQFIYRIGLEFPLCDVALITKLDWRTSPTYESLRRWWDSLYEFAGGSVFHSKTFEAKGEWPVALTLWRSRYGSMTRLRGTMPSPVDWAYENKDLFS